MCLHVITEHKYRDGDKFPVAPSQFCVLLELPLPKKMTPGRYTVSLKATAKITAAASTIPKGDGNPKPVDYTAYSNAVSFEVSAKR